jgi:hypothetical protein
MKKQNITLSIALAAIFSSSVAFAEPEVTGKITHESGFFTNAGTELEIGVNQHIIREWVLEQLQLHHMLKMMR